MKLIIQIPCYNEEETLHIALDHLPKQIEGIDKIEILIINDGSQDGTVQKALDWGVDHVVSFKQNRGLAKGFVAGLDACLRCGADIIVNTDADDQYNGEDIEKLVRPILNGEADIVIGARPIDETEHFSYVKKRLQHLGSWTVRKASKTVIPDAPSGFRAYSREAAMRINVINDYTYTLETIVQAGRERIPMTSVPVRTNPELRSSRLFHSMWGYIKKSILTIIRSYMWYRPLTFFTLVGIPFAIVGLVFIFRFLWFYFQGSSAGHIQSLILAATLLIIGFITFMIGLVADMIAANRKILQDTQYHVKRLEYDLFNSTFQKESDDKAQNEDCC